VIRSRLPTVAKQYEIIEHGGSVVIVPIDGMNVLFVRQYRHATGLDLLELPAGRGMARTV
jgi:ADP-ribose pyrophosphatase